MPEANYSTVLDRWRRWTLCNDAVRPGTSLDHDGLLVEVLRTQRWKNLTMVRDANVVNSNLVAKCE
eukprot:3986636-Pyramimonas_sp.AAC.1